MVVEKEWNTRIFLSRAGLNEASKSGEKTRWKMQWKGKRKRKYIETPFELGNEKMRPPIPIA
jgi:hypothetical protein